MPVVPSALEADLMAIYQQAKSGAMDEEEFAQKMAAAISKQILTLTVVATAPPGIAGGPCTVVVS